MSSYHCPGQVPYYTQHQYTRNLPQGHLEVMVSSDFFVAALVIGGVEYLCTTSRRIEWFFSNPGFTLAIRWYKPWGKSRKITYPSCSLLLCRQSTLWESTKEKSFDGCNCYKVSTMIVSLDSTRALHFVLLLGLTISGGQLLIQRFDWSNMAAYACSCSIVCQVSTAILKLKKGSEREKSTRSEAWLKAEERQLKKRKEST